jgi:polyisoprenoid-binding protein YceI
MKIRTFIAGNIACVLMLAVAASAAELSRFNAKPGSLKVRMEGTSNIHDWQVEGNIIGGYLEVGPGFPVEPGQAATPGKVEAKAEAYIPVRSLFSIEKDGKKYSDKMDEVMYEHLRAAKNPRIVYRLSELTLKEPAKSKDAPYVFDSKGELVVAGVTNTVSMPVNVTPLGDKKIKVTGATTVKMTDFKVEPPAPAIALGMIKTGDEVKLSFDWMVAQKPAAK